MCLCRENTAWGFGTILGFWYREWVRNCIPVAEGRRRPHLCVHLQDQNTVQEDALPCQAMLGYLIPRTPTVPSYALRTCPASHPLLLSTPNAPTLSHYWSTFPECVSYFILGEQSLRVCFWVAEWKGTLEKQVLEEGSFWVLRSTSSAHTTRDNRGRWTRCGPE